MRRICERALLLVGESVQEVLECDLRLEQNALPVLREGIAHCESVRLCNAE
jgi:bacterioferritin